jgi:flagellar biosynthesis protein FliP
MIFLNFSQLLEIVFRPNFPSNFFLTGKYFSLTNFFNDKQTQKNFKNNFIKIAFQKINITQAYKRSIKILNEYMSHGLQRFFKASFVSQNGLVRLPYRQRKETDLIRHHHGGKTTTTSISLHFM